MLAGDEGREEAHVKDLTLGIDIGTSSLKAVVARPDGTVVARRKLANRIGFPTSERMEHDARRAWWLAPRRVMTDLSRLGVAEPTAICVAGLVPSLAAVDGRGRPVSAGLLYGDTRGTVPAELSTMPVGRAPELLRHLVAAEPSASAYWPVQAVANRSLGGPGAIDVTTAIAMSPLFDGSSWDVRYCAEAGCLPENLPEVAGIAEPIGKVGSAVLASGIVDTLAEQIVAGAVEIGDVLVICGTTLVIWVVTDEWKEVPGLWTVPHTVAGRTLIGGASNAGGMFLDWATKFTGSAPGQTNPASIPVWAPYPRGERTPLHDTALRASLIGLELSHDRPQVRRAAFEAAGFVVRQHIDLAGIPARRVVATGGGTSRAEWLQALADCTRLPVDVAAVPECGALGAAYVARMSAGLESGFDAATAWARVGRRIEPAESWVDHADDRYQMFQRLVSGQQPVAGHPAGAGEPAVPPVARSGTGFSDN
ncbi:MAG TPA: FGGY-family carbohydrate kinase [Acidimicrobiales bacterium]|nr:FGGY-family carbohydrate kinase [Acidimicrobiales bacterium]